MQELTFSQVEQINGGIAPLLLYYGYMALSINSVYSLAKMAGE